MIPTSRGDVLGGVARGFHDLCKAGYLKRVPRVHAVEPIPRIARVSDGVDYRALFSEKSLLTSLGGGTVAYQALDALEMTGGSAVVVHETDVLEDQRRLASHGLYLELSSASTLTGLRSLIQRRIISSEGHVTLLATSHGYKEEPCFKSPIPEVTP